MNDRHSGAGQTARPRLRRLAAALMSAGLAAVVLPVVTTAPAEATKIGCPVGWSVQGENCLGQFADTVGTKSWTIPPGVTSAEIFLVGGGGGGGSSYVGGGKRHAGGGGGGGSVVHRSISVTPGDTWTITTGGGGAASTGGGNSSVVHGGTTYAASGGTAGADATSSGAGAGGTSAVTIYSTPKVTYNGGTAITSGSAAAAGGGGGAGQKAQGAAAEISSSFLAWQSHISLNGIDSVDADWPGLTSGYGGNGYRTTMATEGVLKEGYSYLAGDGRRYYFGSGGGGGKVGDKVDELTAQGGDAQFGDTGGQPAGRGGGGSTTGTADGDQNAKTTTGGGGGGGGAAGTVSQAGGTGGSGLVVIVYVAYIAALDLFKAFDTEAGFDAWNTGGTPTPLTLSPMFDPDKTSYAMFIDPLATTLWLATSPTEDLGRVAVTTSGPEVVTSPTTSSAQNTAFKIQGVQVGTTIITVKAYSRDDVALENYIIKIKVPITPPDPGSRALAWGYASDGSIGDNQSTDDRTSPVLVNNGANSAGTWSRVDGGYDHSCGLGMDNKAYCWGANGDGQLGDAGASGSESLVPVLVSNGDNALGTWKKLDAASSFNCGIGSDNKGYCWGSEDSGRLGDGAASADRAVPGLVVGGANVPGTWKEITAGTYHACGIAGDNKAYCWGYNSYYQLGDGTDTDRDVPVLVSNGANTAGTWKSLSAGYDGTCGIGTDDKAYCWGYNYYGQAGNGLGGDDEYVETPVQVVAGANASGTWKAVTVGYEMGCGIGGDDMAYCWGSDYLGTGADDSEALAPLKVDFPVGTVVESIGMGDYSEHVCAMASDAVWCWGNGSYGQLGDDLATDSDSPVEIALPLAYANAKPIQISIGASHSLMVAEFTEEKVAPGAPTITTITPLDGAADVEFTAGTDGTASVTNYQYRLGSGGWRTLSPADTTSPIRIPGLTNFTEYSITIRAVSADGNSAASNAVTVTPVGPFAPGAPTISSARPLDGAAELTFSAGTPGSAATTNYQYRRGTDPWTTLDPASTTSPLIIPGLTNGTTYVIRIRAVSADGKSPASNSISVTPKGPGVPKPVQTEIKPGKGEILIDGKRAKVTIAVNPDKTGVTLTGPGGLTMVLSGEGADGSTLPVDSDGALILVREGVAQVSGSGFKAASVVKLYMLSKPKLIGTAATDGSGTFAGTGNIPVGIRAGSHVIQAIGVTSSGKTLNLSIAVKVLPAAASVPSKVRNLTVARKLVAQQKAVLDWAPPETGSATSYIVAYRTPGAVKRWVTLVTTERTGYAITGAQSSCSYEFRVAAVNGEGRGPWATVTLSRASRARSVPAGDLVCRL